jgi:hypothetical protein
MSGVIRLLPYAFMAWTGKTLPLPTRMLTYRRPFLILYICITVNLPHMVLLQAS